MAAAVPSSVHQIVRFDVDGNMVTIHAEMGIVAHLESDIPYINPEVTDESNYHSLELVHMVHTPAGAKLRTPQPSTSAIMSGKVLAENGFEAGKGLGKYAQGITEPIIALPTMARGGIGFFRETEGQAVSQGRMRGRGRGNRGGRAGRSINPSVWKGKAVNASYCDIPLGYIFPGPSSWLQDEEVEVTNDDNLFDLFEENHVNVVITGIDNIPTLE